MPGSAVLIALTMQAFAGSVRRQLDLLGQLHGRIGRLRVLIALRQRLIELRRDLAVLDHEIAAIPGALRLQIVVHQHQIGAAPAAEPADIAVHVEARRAMQRAHRPGLLGRHPRLHRLAHHPVEAEQQEIIGVAVVGAHGRALVRSAELGDGADRLRQRVPWRGRRSPAQEHPDPGVEQIVGDVAVDRLMGVGDAGRRIGRNEVAAIDMAGHRPPALQGGGEDGVASLIAHGDRHEIHLLAERRRPPANGRTGRRSCRA